MEKVFFTLKAINIPKEAWDIAECGILADENTDVLGVLREIAKDYVLSFTGQTEMFRHYYEDVCDLPYGVNISWLSFAMKGMDLAKYNVAFIRYNEEFDENRKEFDAVKAMAEEVQFDIDYQEDLSCGLYNVSAEHLLINEFVRFIRQNTNNFEIADTEFFNGAFFNAIDFLDDAGEPAMDSIMSDKNNIRSFMRDVVETEDDLSFGDFTHDDVKRIVDKCIAEGTHHWCAEVTKEALACNKDPNARILYGIMQELEFLFVKFQLSYAEQYYKQHPEEFLPAK